MRPKLILAFAAALAAGCTALPPPRPLAAGEVYYCCPGSAVPRRILAPVGYDLPGLKTSLSRHRACGTF